MGLRLALGNAIGYTSILKAELVLGLSVLVSVWIYVVLQVDSHKLHHIYYTIFKSDGKNVSQFIRNLRNLTSFTMYNLLLVLPPVYSIVKFSCSGHLQFNFKVSARVTVLLNRKGDLKMVLNQICPSVSCNHRLTTRFILLNLRQSLHDRWFGTVLSSGCRTHPHSV